MSELHVELTVDEARALACAANLTRNVFAPLDVSDLIAPGENTLASAHLKLLSAVERGEALDVSRDGGR
jgi:hypothetical protein